MSWLDAIRRLLGLRSSDEASSSTPKPLEKPAQAKTENKTLAGSNQQSKKKGNRFPLLTGDMTQFPQTSSLSPKQLLTIGLDFGTAFTKVVIGETRTSYAVPFKFRGLENPYLLPCILYIDHSGVCSLQPIGDGDQAVTDMKMKLLDGTAEHQDLVRMVAFIALILRHTRLWLFENQRTTYGGRYLDWYVNVGVPTDSYHHEALVKTYHNIVMAAWALSVTPDLVSIHVADELLSCVSHGRYALPEKIASLRERLIHEEAFGLFPEFVAQVVGYVRSSLRKPDLHLIVDVGAGTVDISIFNVYESDGDDIFPIFAKAVKLLGTNFLMNHRNNRIPTGAKVKWSVQDRTPSQTEFSQAGRIPLKQLVVIDNDFIKHLGTAVRDLLKYTKEVRYPCSPRWQDAIPTFLCGGGASVDVYSEIISRFENKDHAYKVRVEKLPLPQGLNAPEMPENSYTRLSVAYGLSHNAMDIGRIIQANDIADDPKPPRDPDPYSEKYISKDDV